MRSTIQVKNLRNVFIYPNCSMSGHAFFSRPIKQEMDESTGSRVVLVAWLASHSRTPLLGMAWEPWSWLTHKQHNTVIKVRCHAATHSLHTTYQKQSSNCGELARRCFFNDGGLPRSVQLQHHDNPDPPLRVRDHAASAPSPPQQRRRSIWPRGVVGGGAAVHGVEEVQHGLPGHRRLLRLRRRRRRCLPRRQLLAPPQDLRRRAPAHGWPRGSPLLALRPQIFSTHDQWNCYKASEESQGERTRSHQLFSMRKCSVLQKGHIAEVSMTGCSTALDRTSHGPSFCVEGYFRRRSCKIRNSDGEEVARIMRKKAEAAASSLMLGDDVFSLMIQPNVDCAMIMAFIVVLDRICWRPFTPMIWSS
ncbi:hypothetical protein GQ55_3G013000 [Panicum hallii var. hallii]|uniref:Tubby C-terminal domain-containing protein n=1 Tax=Panicum hallii var. hallii TaxID=1504633 RepID=A0A2T7E4L5_9POAL|nr:hypothetical protein GQ55_3G013000 [Panicum hallii var. hallii]